jgi:hypothetical protein
VGAARAGSTGTQKQVGVNRGARERPPRCHQPGLCSVAPSLAPWSRDGRAAPRLRWTPGSGRAPTHPLAPSRAGPPRQRESWRRRAWGSGRLNTGAGAGTRRRLGRLLPRWRRWGVQRRPLLPLLLLSLLPRGDSCCCCCCIAARCARLRRVSCSLRVEITKKEKKKKAPPSKAPRSRYRAPCAPLLLVNAAAAAAMLLRLRLQGTHGPGGGGGGGGGGAGEGRGSGRSLPGSQARTCCRGAQATPSPRAPEVPSSERPAAPYTRRLG